MRASKSEVYLERNFDARDKRSFSRVISINLAVNSTLCGNLFRYSCNLAICVGTKRSVSPRIADSIFLYIPRLV